MEREENLDVISKDSDIIIIANPGTGKTTALADRVVSLLRQGAKEAEILCITFTNKAAEEMRQRITERIRTSNIPEKDPAKISIHTFHSFANDYLTSNGDNRELASNNFMRYSILRNFDRSHAFNYPRNYIISDLVPKCENAIRYLKSFGILPEDIKLDDAKTIVKDMYSREQFDNVNEGEIISFLSYFITAYKEYEDSKGARFIDYSDMLINFLKVHNPDYKLYKYVLVDELQDVNELEARIALDVGDRIFLVGDRKQAIFGFQGGSVRNFKLFENRPGIVKIRKEINHRSAKEIIEYAKKNFLANTEDKTYEEELASLRTDKNFKGEVKLLLTDNTNNACVEKAIELLNSGRKCAIITRTNDQLVKISKLLDTKRLEYTSTISASTSEDTKKDIIAFLNGLTSDEPPSIISALFTPFSGLSIKEASDVAKLNEMEPLNISKLSTVAKSFFAMRAVISNKPAIMKSFRNTILPIAFSLGKEEYLTADSMYKNIIDYFETVDFPTWSGLLDYLSVTEDSYEPRGKEKDLVLTTVHKAKGREFDNVIYLPKKTRENFSFIDLVVYAIILAVKKIDIREELKEEHLRVDFVAFTRAKTGLYIIAPRDLQGRYYFENATELNIIEAENEVEPVYGKLYEAFSLFVNGRYDDARKLLEAKDYWLNDMVEAYFQNLWSASYSLVNSVKDPINFLKREILGLKYTTFEAEAGIKAHRIAEGLFKRTVDENQLNDQEKGYLRNIRAINEELLHKLGFSQVSAEDRISMPINDVFELGLRVEGMSFVCKMDAVYEHPGGKYLILDFKTDKVLNNASTHRKQLSVYKRAFCVKNNVSAENVKTGLGFIALRGNVNTGVLGYRLDIEDPKPVQLYNFQRDLELLIEYKLEPNLFINALKEKAKLSPDTLARLVLGELE